jgi:type IV pilus assembly protein PilE
MQSRQRTRGITLIELMIVVVIVGILASIAYPNYREFAARAKRTEAKTALLKIATNQERFLLDNNTYTEDLLPLGFSSSPFITETGSYRVRVMPGANANNFTAEAVFLLGGSEANKCARFTLDGRGIKESSPETDCWERIR